MRMFTLVLILSFPSFLSASFHEQIPLFEWSSLWQDLQWMFSNCSDRLQESYLCRGNGHKKECSCERHCIEHGDCCFDFARSFIHERTNALLPVTSCVPLNNEGTTQIYMINSCPITNQTQGLKSKCEKSDPYHHFLLDVPVTSRDGLLTFSNVFCALCHEESDFRAFNYSLSCSNQNIIQACGLSVTEEICIPENYNPGSRTWTKFLHPDDSQNNCTVAGYPITCQLDLHVDIPRMRTCSANTVKTCTRKEDTLGLIYCNLYSLPYDIRGRVYQNPHCARCNGITLPESGMCNARESSRMFMQSDLKVQSSEMMKPFELTFMDIRCGEDDEGSKYFWNGFSQECYYVHCGELYENRNGKCMYKNFTGGLNKDCHTHLELRPWEIRQLSNGSIHYKRKNILFDVGDYELYFIQNEEDPRGPSRLYRICSPNPDSPFFKEDKTIRFQHEVFTSLSLISLSLHIFIHTALKKLRNLFVQNILALSCALFVHQFLLITGLTYKDSHSICIFIATTLHYFGVVSYLWMNVISADLCRACLKRKLSNSKTPGGKRRFKFYSYFAWGLPLFIVSLGLILDQVQDLQDYHPYYAKGDLCWINTRKGLLGLLVLPLSLSLLLSLGLLSTAFFQWIKFKQDTEIQSSKSSPLESSRGQHFTAKEPLSQVQQLRKLGKRLLNSFIMYLLMSLVFLFGILGIFTGEEGLWYPFVFFNGLQGIWIFIAYNFRMKVYYMIYEKVLGRPHPSSSKKNKKTTGEAATPLKTPPQKKVLRHPERKRIGRQVQMEEMVPEEGETSEDYYKKKPQPPPTKPFKGHRTRSLSESSITSGDIETIV